METMERLVMKQMELITAQMAQLQASPSAKSYTPFAPQPVRNRPLTRLRIRRNRFIRSGREVAHVSKAFFSWSDTYGIDIVDGEDDITILATAVVIDLVNDDQRRK